MDTHNEHGPHNPDTRYEKTDARVRPIVYFAVGLGILAVIVHLVLWGFYAYLKHSAKESDKPSFYVRDERWTNPDLQLEVHPSRQYEEVKAAEDKRLSSYGWTDPQAGTAHIPIERAMELSLARGFPVRKDAPAQPQDFPKQIAPQQTLDQSRGLPETANESPESVQNVV